MRSGMASRNSDVRALWRRRADGLARFAEWERDHVDRDATPAARFAAASTLYEWLPPDARRRAIDPSGVVRLHRCLRVLMPTR